MNNTWAKETGAKTKKKKEIMKRKRIEVKPITKNERKKLGLWEKIEGSWDLTKR